MSDRSLPLAVTMGDPAGIGGELALKAWLGHRHQLPCFLLIDDPDRLHALAAHLKLDVPLVEIESAAEATDRFAVELPVMPVALPAAVQPGIPNPANASSIVASIETAVRLAIAGDVRAVVTNPIHKKSLYAAGFTFPGHTEFLASLAGPGSTPVMMLAAPSLRVIPATVHVSLQAAITALTTAVIIETGMIAAAALVTDFGIARPRLAVAGLNPHAGEDGAIGNEEAR